MTAAPAGPVWLFPGQGAQRVGMGRDLFDAFPEARDVFQRADDALGRPLSRIIFEGPEADLLQTVNAQPAIVVTSLACLAAARCASTWLHAPPLFVAGHSLGEYTALVAAGSLDLDDGIRLVQQRGRLMQAAGERNPGSMAAVFGLDELSVASVCDETGAEICNVNSAVQIVIGGPHAAVARAMDLGKARGARRIIPLKVSGAFHSSLMRPAADAMRRELATIPFRSPAVPIVANVTGSAIHTGEHIRNELADQICRAVRWRQSVEFLMQAGVTTYLEIGPGAVLTGLVKNIARDLAPAAAPTLVNLSDVDTVRAAHSA